MKTGDLVKCNWWVHMGKVGIIVKVQDVHHCRGAYILLSSGQLKLIKVEHLETLN